MRRAIQEAFNRNRTAKKRELDARKKQEAEEREKKALEIKEKKRVIKPLEESLKWLAKQFKRTDFEFRIDGVNDFTNQALGDTVFGYTDFDIDSDRGYRTDYRVDFGIGATIIYRGKGSSGGDCMSLYLFPLSDGTMYLSTETYYHGQLKNGGFCKDNEDIQKVVEASMIDWIQSIVQKE